MAATEAEIREAAVGFLELLGMTTEAHELRQWSQEVRQSGWAASDAYGQIPSLFCRAGQAYRTQLIEFGLEDAVDVADAEKALAPIPSGRASLAEAKRRLGLNGGGQDG